MICAISMFEQERCPIHTAAESRSRISRASANRTSSSFLLPLPYHSAVITLSLAIISFCYRLTELVVVRFRVRVKVTCRVTTPYCCLSNISNFTMFPQFGFFDVGKYLFHVVIVHDKIVVLHFTYLVILEG